MESPSVNASPGLTNRPLRLLGATTALVLAVTVSCTFDSSGLAPADTRQTEGDSRLTDDDAAPDAALDSAHDVGSDAPLDTAPDHASFDAPLDTVTAHDVAPDLTPDLRPFDAPSPDARVTVPISSEALSAAFWAARVPCIDHWDRDRGYSIRVVDTAGIFFVSGRFTLQDASEELIAWVGNAPAVTLVWDPNGCEYEGFAYDWTSAGLLVRQATINHSGQMVLDPEADITDINLINVDDDGRYPEEFATVHDSQLSDHRELLNSVARAKSLILSLAQGDSQR